MILKFWLIDDLYAAPYGRGVLNNLTGTPQYLSWLARKLRPHVGDAVLEIGAGIGNLTGRLMARRMLYVAAEKDPLHLHALRNRFLRTPNVAVQRIDPEVPGDLAGLENCFDTVLCLNVLEHLDDAGRCARITGRHHTAGRLVGGAGAQRSGRLRLAGPQDGPQAALQPGLDPRNCWPRMASRWRPSEF